MADQSRLNIKRDKTCQRCAESPSKYRGSTHVKAMLERPTDYPSIGETVASAYMVTQFAGVSAPEVRHSLPRACQRNGQEWAAEINTVTTVKAPVQTTSQKSLELSSKKEP